MVGLTDATSRVWQITQAKPGIDVLIVKMQPIRCTSRSHLESVESILRKQNNHVLVSRQRKVRSPHQNGDATDELHGRHLLQ
jgi:hypothetical protein